jgi:ribosomal 50S subunit-recycling heat shock protein
MNDAGGVRLDKWLWAARFYKARALRPGDEIQVRRGDELIEVVVRGLSEVRGPAPVAQRLYEETDESRSRRAQLAERRALSREPALDIKGRPTKRDARELRRLRGGD